MTKKAPTELLCKKQNWNGTAVAFLLLPYTLTNFANRRVRSTDYQ